MAKTKISEFSATPANNTDIDSINIAEGCAPSGINDAIRELMAQLKDFQTGAVGDSFNGPIGTSTAAAGAFTTLSASSTVSGTGFSTYLASPPAIGGTAAAAGSFTTLSASSTVTLSGGTANGVAYLNGSKVVTSGSALTFDGSKLTVARASNGDVAAFSNSSDADFLIKLNSGVSLLSPTTSILAFGVSNSEQMRLTSTGLGIGTSSPTQKLHVKSSGSTKLLINSSDNSADRGVYFASSTDSDVLGYISQEYSTGNFTISAGTGSYAVPMIFRTGGAERMRLDSSGNLGLGVTPSAWNLFSGVLQLNGGASVAAFANTTYFMQNAAYISGFKYITTAAAGKYELSDTHKWYTAPSGTAGNAITFTQALTLDASGNMLLGTTSGNSRFNLKGPVDTYALATFNQDTATNNAYAQIEFQKVGSVVGSITSLTSGTAYNTTSDYRLKSITGSITTSGAYIDSLNPVEGTWKADGSTFVGLIAHEVQEASRTQVATGTKDGAEMQAMDYSNSELIANLIAEVKSLRQRVATLEAK